MKDISRIRFTTLLMIAGRQVRTLDPGPEWDAGIEGGMVRVTYRRRPDAAGPDAAELDHTEHTHYFPLSLVEVIEAAPVRVKKGQAAQVKK